MTLASSAAAQQVAFREPGRLGRPELDLGSDPRSDPRMVAALVPFGLHKIAAPPPVELTPRATRCSSSARPRGRVRGPSSGVGERRSSGRRCREHHPHHPGRGRQRHWPLHRATNQRERSTALRAPDSRRRDGDPAHFQPVYARFREELAATGLVVVGVEYRNGGGALGNHQFPPDSTIAPQRWPGSSPTARNSESARSPWLASPAAGISRWPPH